MRRHRSLLVAALVVIGVVAAAPAYGADTVVGELRRPSTIRLYADCLQQHLRPMGVGVVLEAEHLCMSLRGVQKAGMRTTTSALLGLLRDDARTGGEFLSLVTG